MLQSKLYNDVARFTARFSNLNCHATKAFVDSQEKVSFLKFNFCRCPYCSNNVARQVWSFCFSYSLRLQANHTRLVMRSWFGNKTIYKEYIVENQPRVSTRNWSRLGWGQWNEIYDFNSLKLFPSATVIPRLYSFFFLSVVLQCP